MVLAPSLFIVACDNHCTSVTVGLLCNIPKKNQDITVVSTCETAVVQTSNIDVREKSVQGMSDLVDL